VLHRVEVLADREEGFLPARRIPYKNLIPLEEIIAEALNVGRDTVVVRNEYLKLCRQFSSEFEVLIKTPFEALKDATQEKIAQGVVRARQGEVTINPGYDGEFGTVRIFPEENAAEPQLGLF
jgi:PHP family Zn ribbon phosphoesterase